MQAWGRWGGVALVLKSWPLWVWASGLAMAMGMDRRCPCFSCSQPRRAPSGGLFWGSPRIAGVTSGSPQAAGPPQQPPWDRVSPTEGPGALSLLHMGNSQVLGTEDPRVWGQVGQG